MSRVNATEATETAPTLLRRCTSRKPCKQAAFGSVKEHQNAVTVRLLPKLWSPPRTASPTKNPAFAGLFNRGAEIRTRDLTDPNGARYQAAPRPDERPVSHTATAAMVALMSASTSDILAE